MTPAFYAVMEKQAVSAGRTLALIRSRMAQGGRVAPKLLASAEQAAASGATSTPAALRRTALGAGEGARLAQRAKTLPARVGVGTQAAATRSRVADAVRSEAGGAATRSNIPLSNAYEGYMSSAQTAYTPAHTAKVMGIRPNQVKMRTGPTALMNSVGASGTASGHGMTLPAAPPGLARRRASSSAGTRVGASGMRRKALADTVPARMVG